MQSLTNLCHGSAPPLCIKTQKLKNGCMVTKLGDQVKLDVLSTLATVFFWTDDAVPR